MKITIRSHTDGIRTAPIIDDERFHRVFPFETLFSLKQRIAMVLKTAPPSQLFIAVETDTPNYFQPLEFSWPFLKKDGGALINPYERRLEPDSRIYEDGAKKPVFPTLYSGITIEKVPALAIPNPTIHVWTLESLLQEQSITEPIFEGFIKLYFPQLRDVPTSLRMNITSLETLTEYRNYIEKRYENLESGIASATVQEAELPEISKLYIYKCILPRLKNYNSSLLELKFYEMAPSPMRPFLRFFSAKDRVPSIIKLATKGDKPIITNQKLLDSFMADMPSTEMGAIILIKYPIDDPRTKRPFEDPKLLGICWTIRIYEDGSAEMYIGAPRRGTFLKSDIIKASTATRDEILKELQTDIDFDKIRLCELSAVYEFETKLEGRKPGKPELLNRLDTFLPLFSIDPPLKDDDTPAAALILRYKAVSNYVKMSDPIMNYLTLLYLNHTTTDVAMPTGAYVRALVKEFGISPEEAAQAENDWLQRHSEHVILYRTNKKDELHIKELAIRDAKCSAKPPITTDIDTTIAAYNVGASVRIYNEHPRYRIVITGCESKIDLERMLTLMTLLLSETAENLYVEKTKLAETAVEETEANIAEETAPEEPAELAQTFDFGLMNMGDANEEEGEEESTAEDEEEEEEEGDSESSENEKAEAPIDSKIPIIPRTVLASDEKVGKITEGWYLNKLKSSDADLFESGTKLYSRQCQPSQSRYPNVLSKEAYRRLKLLYGDKVKWIEYPLEPKIEEAYMAVVGTAVNQRKGNAAKILEYEKIILNAGFPLKEDRAGLRSITQKPDDQKTGKPTIPQSIKDQKGEIFRLIEQQESIPTWVVTHTGTDKKHMNNYICSEFWCLRDDYPLIESDFQGEKGYDGKRKMANSCPFCSGTLIKNPENPGIGETVLQRPTWASYGKVAKYAGFINKIHHRDKFAVPCCFIEPTHIIPPDGARQLIKDAETEVEKPQTDEQQTEEQQTEKQQTEEPLGTKETKETKDNTGRNKPFSLTAGRSWYIPNQNVLGRINLDWWNIDKGTIAVPPQSVNKLIGQDPNNFLTKGINLHLKPDAHAFIRYGIDMWHNEREPGKSFLSLLAWIKYSIDELQYPNTNYIMSDEEIKKELIAKMSDPLTEIAMARAFEQANYGTLIHEFKPAVTETGATTGNIQNWCVKMGLCDTEGGAIPAAVKTFYYAWNNFKKYIVDTTADKDIRLLESLLAVPGLFTKYGILLVRIIVPKNKTDEARIVCPNFGISVYSKSPGHMPPFLFLIEDEKDGFYDPLVLYNGKGEKERKLYGVINFESAGMSTPELPPTLRVPLEVFIKEYVSEKGCGRSVPPTHPWLPVREMDYPIPSITDLESIKEPPLVTQATKLLRDRSNRLVGIILEQDDGTKVYIPCIDDGNIIMECASAYNEESLRPFPSIETVVEYYTTIVSTCKRRNIPCKNIALKLFRTNEENTHYVGIDLLCGITIPIQPISKSDPIITRKYNYLTTDEKGETPKPLRKGQEPWSDLALMTPATSETSIENSTKEEELEEAYQHLRITLSDFLAGNFQDVTEQAKGRKLKEKIEALRQARRRLPLFELQRRLDSLLYPYVKQWVKQDNNRPSAKPSVLRRECTQITKESDCIEGCSWTQEAPPLRQCLIHTTATKRYMDPVYLMAARLTDELLRTFGKAMEIMNHTISRLKPLQGSEFRYENSSLLFTALDRGTQMIYDILGYTQRQPTKYTAGLTYPEEVPINEASIDLPDDWKDALYRIQVSPYLISDPRAFMLEVVRDKAKLIEPGQAFTGTYKDWETIAHNKNINIIRTYYNSKNGRIDILDKILIPGAKEYIVLDIPPYNVPLQNHITAGFTLTKDKLPEYIQEQLK